jgi:tRNA(adenine34) deaminase
MTDEDMEFDGRMMAEALRLAEKAGRIGETPVGAIIAQRGRIIARAFNQVEMLKDATAHAEMLALTMAQTAVGDWRLTDCVLYVTKEPCPMCAGAVIHCRLARVVYGAPDPKGGAAGGALNLLQFPGLNHRCAITAGVMADASADLLREFFRMRRAEAKASRKAGAEGGAGAAEAGDGRQLD